jgi:ribonuclease HI
MIDRTQGIAVDAAHSTKNRMTEYRGVDLKTGKVIFHEKLGNQTVNIGEFLAIVEGVKHIYETGYTPKVIFSDSMVAITWFINRKTASGKRNMELMKAESFIRIMDEKIKDIKVIHWDNKNWGEIAADFGRK